MAQTQPWVQLEGTWSRFARVVIVVLVFTTGLLAAWLVPHLDRALNPDAHEPGLVSYLGVGLVGVALTALLLFLGLRSILPRGALFLFAALGYNALVIVVKFGISPSSIYSYEGEPGGYQYLSNSSSFPFLAAMLAAGYGGAFFFIYMLFHQRVQSRLGAWIKYERRAVEIAITLFALGVVGVVTGVAFNAGIEYVQELLVLGSLVAVAACLVGAIALCSVAFKEAADQAIALRNVAFMSTFAWVGLAFIAAYHVMWFVFLLTLVSIWPLRYGLYK